MVYAAFDINEATCDITCDCNCYSKTTNQFFLRCHFHKPARQKLLCAICTVESEFWALHFFIGTNKNKLRIFWDWEVQKQKIEITMTFHNLLTKEWSEPRQNHILFHRGILFLCSSRLILKYFVSPLSSIREDY